MGGGGVPLVIVRVRHTGSSNLSNLCGEEHGLCYGVKRRKESRSGTSQNPQIPTPNLTPTKNTNHMFYSVRGDFWGMHKIDRKGTSNLRFVTV